MKKLSMLLLLISLSLMPTRAQTIPATANLTASDSGACTTAGACLTVNVTPSSAAAVIQLTGTFSATLQFEGTTSVGGTFVAVSATPIGGGSAVTSATATGSWRVTASGLAQIRVRCSAFTSGTVVAAITLSTGSSGTSSAGSGGTITAVTGTPPIVSSGGTTPAISCPTCNTSSSNVTSVFTRTGAVVAAANDYTLDQIGNPAANTSFSFGSFTLGITAPGVFTGAAQNNQFLQTLTGGGTCDPKSIASSTAALRATDVLASCGNTPTSGVTNWFTDGMATYLKVNDPNQGGTAPGQAKVQGNGLYAAVLCAASNTKCEGVDPQVSSGTSLTGVQLIGMELGVVPFNTTDTGFGILLSFESSNSQPTADNMPAMDIQAPTGSGTWTSGYKCETGSISSTATELYGCLNLGAQIAGSSQNSQFVFFNATNSGGTGIHTNVNLNQDNVMSLGGRAWSAISPSTDESFGIGLTATAALPINTLVKIDTAHADSVVICTTTDTICSGFSVGTNNATGLCAVGSTVCAIATTTGSKVNGILGTGTCAIGNWVIVDTTTNGRVKCATTQSIAWQGFALSVQSSVGSLVDVLVSPGGSAATTVKTLSTATNCAGVGTAASPSVATCGSAAAGHFSCATNATGATCTVNTTAVTANSEIFVFESDTTVTGTALGVTCNTSTTVNPATRLLASSVAATSFTINLGTVTTNPACFSYQIIN